MTETVPVAPLLLLLLLLLVVVVVVVVVVVLYRVLLPSNKSSLRYVKLHSEPTCMQRSRKPELSKYSTICRF